MVFCYPGVTQTEGAGMPTIKFTVRSLDALKPPATGRVEYWDADVPGLGLRMSDRGRKTWTLLYRAGGRQRRFTLGTYPALPLADARDKAKDALRAVAHGKDPAAEKKAGREADTVGELADLYIERHAKPNKRSWETDQRMLKRDVIPEWGRRKVKDIKRRDVIAWLDKIVARGAPIMANRTYEVARMMFNFAVSRDLIEASPFFGVSKPNAESQRERVLTADEIRSVWKAIDAEAPNLAAILKLRLITAQRGAEVVSMRWQDINLDAGSWIIPGEFTKNGREHRVPLAASAVTILRELAQTKEDQTWVFPGKRGARVAILWRSGDRVRAVSKVDFVPHDLRRTAASHMASMGIMRLTISKILNHTDPSVTSVYDRHSYDTEKRSALDAWATRLEEIITGKQPASNVAEFKRA
jgi:integrase